MSESIASSLGSNLNKVTSGMPIIGGPSDLKKMLLGDDYFSDVNPRSMRRLMNIIHITGRLLKCFSIDFNWYHLSAWANVTEQWPYRLSWIIIYCEHFQKDLDDGMSLKSVYERVRPFIPTSKDIDQNVTLDRDEKKLDTYLGMHKGSLLVSTLYVFLPFTISLDPSLRKDITEQYQPVDQLFKSNSSLIPASLPGQNHSSFLQPLFGHQAQPSPQPHALRYRGGPAKSNNAQSVATNGFPPSFYPGMQNFGYPPNMWMPSGSVPPGFMGMMMPQQAAEPSGIIDLLLVKDLRHKKLSTMTVEGVCDLLVALTGIKSSQVTKYQETVRKSNISGRALLNCDLSELKLVLQMSFGDWEMFKSAILILRDAETKSIVVDSKDKSVDEKNNNNNNSSKEVVRISVTSPGSPPEKPPVSKSQMDLTDSKKPQLRPNVLEKQVTMEEQMICGALELLNDEAKEDARKGEDSSSTLSPINSEPEPQNYEHRKSSKAYLSQDETDVLYVMGTSLNVTAELPDSPSVVRKLEEAEAKYSLQNESHQNQRIHHVRSLGSTSAISDPISIPSGSLSGKKFRPSSLSRNATHTGNVTMSSPLKSKSLGAKDYKPQAHQRSTKSPVKDSLRKGCRKSTSQHLQNLERDSSTDASSDESQKPLVMKPLGSDKHSRRVTTTRSPRPPVDPTSSPKKKRVSREDSIASKFSRIKSSFFGQSNDQSFSPAANTSVSQRREYRPVRYDLPTEDSSEPSQYFKEHGHPWTAYRAPTPLPPFGTDEYYQVIKSSNPSPTTSNESEIGSTPEDISSKEDLFLPGPPDLPESPYPRRSNPENEAIRSENIEMVRPSTGMPTSITTYGSSFVPITAAQAHRMYDPPPHGNGTTMSQKSKSIRRITVASSGEETVGHPRRLTRTSMNQSDPVLSPSFNRIESDPQIQSESVHSQRQQQVTNTGSQSIDQSQRVGSPPLIRQAAIADTNSSRENTPQM